MKFHKILPSSPSRARVARVGVALAAAVLALLSASAFGQLLPATSATSSASVSPPALKPGSSATAAPSPVSPHVARLRAQSNAVQQLVDGTLPATVEPADLFDVDLSDEAAVAVERLRLAAIVQWSSEMAAGEEDKAAPEASNPSTVNPSTVPSASASTSTRLPDVSPTPQLRALYRTLMAERPADWNARRALDRSQLAFLSLSAPERIRRLEQHSEARRSEEESRQKANEAEAAAESAKAEQARLLEEAKRAKTEAARLVAEEHARLLGVVRQLSEMEQSLAGVDGEMAARTEALLAWRRRVNEALAAPSSGRSDPLYSELRTHLSLVRDELEAALPGLTVNPDDIEVPSAGPDPLVSLPEGVDASEARQARVDVMEKMKAVQRAEASQRIARARQLMEEMERLNRMRLELLPTLTSAKYDEVAGFGPGGLDQAGAETRQVFLTLRYHLRAARAWLSDLGSTQFERRQSAWAGSMWLIKATLMFLGLLWWRRRADETLTNLRDGERERRAAMVATDRMDERILSERMERGLSFLMHVRRPLEILLFVGLLWWLLSASARASLEVQLLTTVVAWVSGGRLVVTAIDALSRPEVTGTSAAEAGTTTALRLRSLELAGRTVVVFGLILALSKLLVGGGTIYSWVWSTCWFASVPIFLVIVRWWQPVIFERLSSKRRPSRFDKLLLAQRQRWTRYPAAIAGAVTQFGAGTTRWVRARLTTLTLARKLLAYLFQRDMTRRAAAVGQEARGEDLPPELSEKLGPEVASGTMVDSVADRQLTVVTSRIELPGGGIFAVVGERGGGKTTLMTRLAKTGETIVRIACSPGMGVEGVRTRLLSQLALPESTSLAEAIEKLDGDPIDSAILVDDAHLLLTPRLGGLADFDAILELARRHTRNCTWVFAFDEIVWRFLERARGSRPLFDDVIKLEPWSEEGIARLIEARLDDAGLTPDFDLLLEGATGAAAEADGLDLEEARLAARTNFMRLLWDYASGNPGVAMHFWRRSLGQREEGRAVVRLFEAPSPDEIDKLPDASIFVLRAVAQLGRAEANTVVAVTSLAVTEVEDALRFATAKGYLERGDDGHYSLTWNWFPAVTRLLRRRQLIFKAG